MPIFQRTPPPTDQAITERLVPLERRVRRRLVRRGRRPDDDGGTDPFAAQAPRVAHAVAASLPGRVTLGPRAGQPVRRLRSAAAAAAAPPRGARLEAFRLHAAVAVPAPRRDRLEHRCRSLRRPPLALDRWTETSGRQLLSEVRRPWADGSTALRLTPLERLERLPGLVPAPRAHGRIDHGLLAPQAAW